MAYFASDKCQVKKGIFNCGAPRTGVCQYCGRAFCERHGERFGENEEVCSRPNCVAKKEDLARHTVYKDAVFVRNKAQACGEQGCTGAVNSQCTRCNGYFCEVHVQSRRDTILDNGVRVDVWAGLCQHCYERRPIWLKP